MEDRFDELYKDIQDYVNTNDPATAHKRAKVASCVFDILVSDLGIELSKPATTIKSKYGRRVTQSQERTRRQNYVGTFEAKGSRAEKLVRYYHKELPSDNLLVGLFYALKEEKIITELPRESTRTKNAIYKFIEDNYELFEQLFKYGTRCEWEKKEA